MPFTVFGGKMEKCKEDSKDTFATRLMRKHGWSEGSGLGKKQTGIVDPIKASLKFDKAGIGHDIAKEFTNNWWDVAYKKAANSFEVEENTSKDEVTVKTKKKKAKKQKPATNRLYAQFTKGGTLEGGKMVEEEQKHDNSQKMEEDKDDEKISFKKISDDELFAACGGLTAHKGARHGFDMTAKQKRIELMDAKLMEEMTQKSKKRKESQTPQEQSKKKKKKKPDLS